MAILLLSAYTPMKPVNLAQTIPYLITFIIKKSAESDEHIKPA